MHYDYYIEPCQFCITRAKNGADISDCGWCGSGEDTRYRTSHEHPGDIVKIPAGGYGYPYHDSPHPERKYYRDGRHIPEMDGRAPICSEGLNGDPCKDEGSPLIGCLIIGPFLVGLALTFITDSPYYFLVGTATTFIFMLISTAIYKIKSMAK